MTAIPSWREVLLGPPVQRDYTAASQTGNMLGSSSSAAPDQDVDQIAGVEPPRPMAEPGLPRDSSPSVASGKPGGIFEARDSFRYGGMADSRPLFSAPKPRYHGPATRTDTIVYDRPNGEPLPAPSLTRTALVLLRGTHIRVSEREGDWVRILTPAGERGWVKVRDVSNLPQHLRGSAEAPRKRG